MSEKRAQVQILVEGMSCQGCVNRLQQAFKQTAGVSEAEVDLPAKRATVQYDPEQTNAQTLAETVREAGFEPGEPLPSKRIS